MSIELKVILGPDTEEILDFEHKKLVEQDLSSEEAILASWSAPWRKESLNHYIPMGWSFLARSTEGKFLGYFLAQPLLFFDKQTQSLWVEHLQANSLLARDALTDLAYRIAREKHLQRVYFPNQPHILNSVGASKPESWGSQMIYVKTTKA